MPVHKTKPQSLPRPLTDRRARTVLDSLEKVLTCSYRHECIANNHGDVMVDHFMTDVMLWIIDGATVPGGWTDDAIRAVVAAFVTNCPDAYMSEAVKKARRAAIDAANYSKGDFS